MRHRHRVWLFPCSCGVTNFDISTNFSNLNLEWRTIFFYLGKNPFIKICKILWLPQLILSFLFVYLLFQCLDFGGYLTLQRCIHLWKLFPLFLEKLLLGLKCIKLSHRLLGVCFTKSTLCRKTTICIFKLISKSKDLLLHSQLATTCLCK